MNAAFDDVIGAADADRRDVFLAAARRLGTAVSYIEKDFWVCWTLREPMIRRHSPTETRLVGGP